MKPPRPHRSRCTLAIALVAGGVLANAAFAQPAVRTPLTAALTVAPVAIGWRVEKLADGRLAAIGTDATAGPMHVIGIACGASKRPEIAADIRGGASGPRALLIETGDSVTAFPIDAGGAAATGVDALVADIMLDAKSKMWLDQQVFPTDGAQDALAQVGKDCERSGWQYGNDDAKQLVWVYSARGDEPPSLTFGKPSTGWLLTVLTCDQASKSVTVKSTALPSRSKSGQAIALNIQVGDWKVSANGRAEILDEGDVAGFVVATLNQPRLLLDALANGKLLTLRSKSAMLAVSTRGLGQLLPRFQAACNL